MAPYTEQPLNTGWPLYTRWPLYIHTSKKCTYKKAEDGKHLPRTGESRPETSGQQEDVDGVEDSSTTIHVGELASNTSTDQCANHLDRCNRKPKVASVTDQVPLWKRIVIILITMKHKQSLISTTLDKSNTLIRLLLFYFLLLKKLYSTIYLEQACS